MSKLRNIINIYGVLYTESTGNLYRLNSKNRIKLRTLIDKLVELDIDCKHYIELSYAIWLQYMNTKGMNYVPLAILCGDKAFDRYIAIDIPTRKESDLGTLRYYEMGVAALTVDHHLGLVENLQDELLTWLPANWHAMTTKYVKEYLEIVSNSVKAISARYYVHPDFNDYESVAFEILDRRK